MTNAIQRAFHSSQPEGQGNVNAPVDHFDAQRDLWELLLPMTHLRSAALYGSGVLTGLRVSGTLNSAGLRVMPGLALDPGGRLLPVTLSSDDGDLRVRLQPPSEGGSTLEGLAPVGQDGVALDTLEHSGERFVVLEWSETRIRADERTFYRLTPWLRLEPVAADPTRRWVVLARVLLGTGAEQGLIKRLDVGPRLAMTSFRDGLTLRRPTADAIGPGGSSKLTVDQAAVAALRARSDDVLDIAFWDRSQERWLTALSVDGATGKVGIGTDATDAMGKLDVAGAIHATSLSADKTVTRELTATQVTAAQQVTAQQVNAKQLTVEDKRMPIIRSGHTDPLTTPWQQYQDPNCVFVDVDTTAAGFEETPNYFASLGGTSNIFLVTGVSAIYAPTPKSFRLYLRTPTMKPAEWTLSPGYVKDKGWYINWVGILPR